MKFNSPHDEYLYEGSVISGAVTGDGDVEAPTGWFAGITLEPDMDDPADEEYAAQQHYGTRWLILHESNEGFVTVLTFEDEVKRNRHLRDLEQAYALYQAEVRDEEIRLAIDNYLAAVKFTDGIGAEVPFSAEAQVSARDEVTDFVTQNIEAIREFQRVTGHGWEQIGIDFWLTRNGHGAGFWDRGAGEVGKHLTEASKPWGEVNAWITHDMEVVFS